VHAESRGIAAMNTLLLALLGNAAVAYVWTSHDRRLFGGVLAFMLLSEATAVGLFFGALYALANMR
jgi:hypothetical protein